MGSAASEEPTTIPTNSSAKSLGSTAFSGNDFGIQHGRATDVGWHVFRNGMAAPEERKPVASHHRVERGCRTGHRRVAVGLHTSSGRLLRRRITSVRPLSYCSSNLGRGCDNAPGTWLFAICPKTRRKSSRSRNWIACGTSARRKARRWSPCGSERSARRTNAENVVPFSFRSPHVIAAAIFCSYRMAFEMSTKFAAPYLTTSVIILQV